MQKKKEIFELRLIKTKEIKSSWGKKKQRSRNSNYFLKSNNEETFCLFKIKSVENRLSFYIF